MPGPSNAPSAPFPKYRLHKRSGLGVVTLNGRDHYLGKYGTRESVEAYGRLIAEWLAGGRQLLHNADGIAIADLMAAFLRYAEQYYRNGDGSLSGEVENYHQAFRPLKQLYGSTPAQAFGPKALRAVQQEMIRLDWCRNYINGQVNRIRSFFKWAVSQELVPSGVYEALRTVAPLKRGRSAARESEPVRPVPLEHVQAIQPFVSRQVWALVQIQLYTGARAGELVIMRPIDLEMTDTGDWLYRPATHKTEHHGHQRIIAIGPRAQDALNPLLAGRPVDAYVFSAAEAEAERRALLHARRKTPLSCGNRPGTNVREDPERQPRDHYDVASYRRAIARACDAAGVPRWHPHQLRHNAATEIRRRYGLEMARVVLGHQTMSMTQLYAEADIDSARAVIRQIG